MKRFVKENKGITLIALIITIIVMLILVAVTISVALNGGIFNKATDAKQRTQREADREELLSSVYATLDNSGNLQIEDELKNNLPDGWPNPTQSENEEYLKCTSAKGEIFFVNIETGAILDKLPTTDNGNDENNEGEQGEGNETEEVWYDLTFRNLSQIDLLSTFSEGNYCVGLEDKNENTSLIAVMRGEGNCMIQYLPNSSDFFTYYAYTYGSVDSFGVANGEWRYIELNKDSSVSLNPSTIENIKMDYTAGTNMSVNNLTETMLNIIAIIEEAE